MRFLLAIFVGTVMFVPVWAQTQGEITGVVTDPSGAVVSGASVTVTNPQTNFTRQVNTNTAGNYTFPGLLPGVYNVKAEIQGFQTAARNGIELQVQQVARIDFELKVGAVAEVVEVSGAALLLTTENATVGTVIENKRIVELPLNGRNFLQLVSLSPNVSFGFGSPGQAQSRQGGSRSEQNIAIAGQRSMFNHFTLDGVENTDVNFNTYVILPSIDALQEFKVQTGVYPAEFGRAASQINVSTKAGTNDFHGALFEFLRNDKIDAKNYAFTVNRPPKDPFKWNQYGFTLGGPVWIPKLYNGKNRLFFLSNFEGYRDRKQLRGTYSVPSAAMRDGNFAEISARLYDPNTRAGQPGSITAQPFAGNVIPRSRIHATSIKLMEFYPGPNVSTGSLVSNYQIGQNRRIDKDQFIQRVDFVESNSSNWFGRYSWGDEQQVTPALKLNGTNLLTNVKQAMINNNRVLSAAVVNEFRFGYNKFFNSQGRELAFVRDVVGELKIPGLLSPAPVAWGIPSVGISGFSGFGDDSEGPYENRNYTFQWVDNVSWTRGKHSLRFGVEIRRDRYNQVGNQFARGSFGFEGQATQNPASVAGTGQAFADYVLGQCRRCEASVALAVTQFRATSQYYYIDDTWKIRPNLTLNIGLRYENTPPWFDKGGSLVNIHVPYVDATPNVQDLSRHPTFIRIGSGDFYEGKLLRFNPAIKVARDGRLGDRLIASDNNDFAPRFGMAWSPTNKWTVRTGAGMFYSQDTGNPRFDMGRNFAGRRRDESNADFPDLTWDQPFRNLGATIQINNPYVLGNIHQRRTPYSIQYLLNVQRELDRQTAVEFGYIGSVSRKLESLRAYNESLPGATGTVLDRAPYPEFSRIQEVDGSGKAHYDSLSLKLQRRFSQGLTYLVGYTFSKSIDTASGIRNNGGDTLFPQNSYCIRCERGLSIFHVSQRMVTSILYELPLGKGKAWLNRGGVANVLAGGWQLGSIITLQTGFPIIVGSGRDQSNTGSGNDRPNATGQKVALGRGQQDPERFFNTDAFVLQPFGTFGNVGRNTLIGPGLISWDFSTLKNFAIREGHELQFRFEAFNFPNHPNWGNPSTAVNNVNFGKIRGTRTNMRELQFGLKYVF
ncbi:MAG: TonB-dependent receptor [Acidobacteria bacterium]|nr:TonB-dependent receptor [Acidobacteriota bacterium]